MSEAVSFWMDNKNCTGTTAATIENQSLVIYRDRYYVLQGGVAQTKGGKPLRYSLSSLPVTWKRALKGEEQLPVLIPADLNSLPDPIPRKRERMKTEKPAMTVPLQESAPEQSDIVVNPMTKTPRKSDSKPPAQPPVKASCPYCNTLHEIPVEKGKSGKPFFIS